MNLKEYFDNSNGTGVLSTADNAGVVGSAIYSKPRVLEDDRVAFIMRERRMYSNLQSNKSASYLFIENSKPSKGLRLNLEKVSEDDNPELVEQMTRRNLTKEEDEAKGPKHIVYFRVKDTLPLIGC